MFKLIVLNSALMNRVIVSRWPLVISYEAYLHLTMFIEEMGDKHVQSVCLRGIVGLVKWEFEV